MSVDKCAREFWSLRYSNSDTFQDLSRNIEMMLGWMIRQCETPKDYLRVLSMGKFLSLFSLEDAQFVKLQKPSSVLQAANLMEERLADRTP